MTTIGNPSKTSIVAEIRDRLAGRSQMDGKAGTIVRKLLDGRRLSAMEQDIVAATGLGGAVADLIGATNNAQTNYSGLAGAKNTADVFLKTRAVMNKAAEADRIYAQNHSGYAKVSSTYHSSSAAKAVVATQGARDKVIRTAGDVVTVAGLGLSAASLPGLAQKTVTSFSELGTLVHDPNATTDQRLDKLEELTRSGAGTIFATQGVVNGVKGVGGILTRSKTIANIFTKIGESPISKFVTSPIGKALGVLLPIADGGVFIGEAIATRRTFEDPNATESQKARKVLDVSLAGLKTAFWIFPQVRLLRSIYSLAGLGQLGLTIWDMRTEMLPKIKHAATVAAWGVTHPVQAAKAIGTTVGNAASTAGHWIWDKVSHPGQTAANLTSEAKLWFNNLFNKSRTAVAGWFGPTGAPTQQPLVAQVPAAPVVPVVPTAPVAPVAAASVVAAPAAPVTTAPVAAAPVAAQPTTDAAYQAAMSQISALG
jgi:hypothetical protein